MDRDIKGPPKVHGNGNGSTVKWFVGILVSIALLAAVFANGVVWTLAGDVKGNAVTGATNAANISALKEVLNRIERKIEHIDDQIDMLGHLGKASTKQP